MRFIKKYYFRHNDCIVILTTHTHTHTLMELDEIRRRSIKYENHKKVNIVTSASSSSSNPCKPCVSEERLNEIAMKKKISNDMTSKFKKKKIVRKRFSTLGIPCTKQRITSCNQTRKSKIISLIPPNNFRRRPTPTPHFQNEAGFCISSIAGTGWDNSYDALQMGLTFFGAKDAIVKEV